MRDGHAFRSIGIALGLILALTLAGCGALGGGGGGGCGPGDTEIGDLDPEEREEATIEGEVTEAGPGSFVVDDGSGKAFVMTGEHDYEEGDCVELKGFASPIPGGTAADVGFTPTSAS